MGLFDSFPLSNAYAVNLDWIMKKIQEIEDFVKNYAAVNKVAYAGVWDITKQYPQWALVTDGDTSWLANKPVPVGIPLENAEYWQKLADLDPRIAGIINDISQINNDISQINNDMSQIYDKFGGYCRKFQSVEAMVVENDLQNGDICICASRNNNPVVSLWVISSEPETINVKISDSLYANFLQIDDYVNILAVGATFNTDCSDTVNTLLQAGYNLFFPAGTYRLSVEVPNGSKIRGCAQTQIASNNVTVFTPANGPVFTFNAEKGPITNCILADFEIRGTQDIDGIVTIGRNDNDFVDFCTFENIKITECRNAFVVTSRFIWNVFRNVRFYGNYVDGIDITPPAKCTANHNSFYDCQFAGNRARAIYATAEKDFTLQTLCLYHCNIENNYYENPGQPESFAVWLYNAHGVLFSDCYIENNNGTYTLWINRSDISIIGGTSLLAKNPLVATNDGGKAMIIGMHGYDTSGQLLTPAITEQDSVCIIGSANIGYQVGSNVKNIF